MLDQLGGVFVHFAFLLVVVGEGRSREHQGGKGVGCQDFKGGDSDVAGLEIDPERQQGGEIVEDAQGTESSEKDKAVDGQKGANDGVDD